jgi:rhodanese-related sulfurtransferase
MQKKCVFILYEKSYNIKGMGNAQTREKINFEDMQNVCKHPEIYLIINTLPIGEQDCLILGSLQASQEETVINEYILKNKGIQIILYGKNSHDETIYKKYQQLIRLGFRNVYIYTGGLFEWLMLQDIFGFEDFPTTRKELDFIKYRPQRQLVHLFVGLDA